VNNQKRYVVSKYYCNTMPITRSRVLNSSPGRLDLGGLGFQPPSGGHRVSALGLDVYGDSLCEHENSSTNVESTPSNG